IRPRSIGRRHPRPPPPIGYRALGEGPMWRRGRFALAGAIRSTPTTEVMMNRNDPGLPPTAPQEFAPQGPAAYSTSGAESAPPPHAAAAVAQPPRKSWFARHKILTAILAVIALVVLVNLV